MKRPRSSAPERRWGFGPLAALLLAGGLLARGWWTPPVRAAHSSGSAVAPACVPQSAVAATTPALQAVARVTLYVEPHDGKRVVSRAILRARHSILLQMYLLTDRTLLHDLERAAARGVAVNVILKSVPVHIPSRASSCCIRAARRACLAARRRTFIWSWRAL